MSVYVVLKKKQEGTIFLPNFEVHVDLPAMEKHQKLIILNEGDYVDVADFALSSDSKAIVVEQYKVANVNNHPHLEITEKYFLPRFGK